MCIRDSSPRERYMRLLGEDWGIRSLGLGLHADLAFLLSDGGPSPRVAESLATCPGNFRLTQIHGSTYRRCEKTLAGGIRAVSRYIHSVLFLVLCKLLLHICRWCQHRILDSCIRYRETWLLSCSLLGLDPLHNSDMLLR